MGCACSRDRQDYGELQWIAHEDEEEGWRIHYPASANLVTKRLRGLHTDGSVKVSPTRVGGSLRYKAFVLEGSFELHVGIRIPVDDPTIASPTISLEQYDEIYRQEFRGLNVNLPPPIPTYLGHLPASEFSGPRAGVQLKMRMFDGHPGACFFTRHAVSEDGTKVFFVTMYACSTSFKELWEKLAGTFEVVVNAFVFP